MNPEIYWYLTPILWFTYCLKYSSPINPNLWCQLNHILAEILPLKNDCFNCCLRVLTQRSIISPTSYIASGSHSTDSRSLDLWPPTTIPIVIDLVVINVTKMYLKIWTSFGIYLVTVWGTITRSFVKSIFDSSNVSIISYLRK